MPLAGLDQQRQLAGGQVELTAGDALLGQTRRTSAMLRVVAIVPALDIVKVGEGLNDCRISALGLFREDFAAPCDTPPMDRAVYGRFGSAAAAHQKRFAGEVF